MSTKPATAAPPLDRRVLAVAGIVVLGAITTVLDSTIVSVAINTLSRHFNAELTTIQWVTTAYILTIAMVVPVTGWGQGRFGGRRLWLIALTTFTAGSVLCGLAWSVESLIVFRVLQGLGGGMIVPVGMTLVAQAAGPQRMGRAMSLVGFPMVLGPVLGPVVGGVLITAVDWRWIFFVNLPIGLLAVVASIFVLDRDRPRGAERFDVLGFLLLCPGLALLLYALANIEAANLGAADVLVTGIAGVVLIVLFVLHAFRTAKPLLDLRLFGNATFSAAAAIQFVMGATVPGSMLLFPLYYQLVHGESPLAAGLLVIPQGIGAAMMMPIAGRIVDKGKAGLIVTAGVPLIALGFIAYTQTSGGTSYVLLALSLWIIGLGAGATMMPAMSTAYRALEPPSIPRATATFNIIQYVSAAMAAALFIVVLETQLVSHPTAIATAFNDTFWLPLAIAIVGIVPALVLFRGSTRPAARPQATGGNAAGGAAPSDRSAA